RQHRRRYPCGPDQRQSAKRRPDLRLVVRPRDDAAHRSGRRTERAAVGARGRSVSRHREPRIVEAGGTIHAGPGPIRRRRVPRADDDRSDDRVHRRIHLCVQRVHTALRSAALKGPPHSAVTAVLTPVAWAFPAVARAFPARDRTPRPMRSPRGGAPRTTSAPRRRRLRRVPARRLRDIRSRRAWRTASRPSRRLPPGSATDAVRQAVDAHPIFVSRTSVTRSATARAVVYFVPTTLTSPSMPWLA